MKVGDEWIEKTPALSDMKPYTEIFDQAYLRIGSFGFIYDKGIILVFKDHQIGIELDSWMAEMIAFFRSSDALSKFTLLDYEWRDDGHDSNCKFEAKRFQISLTKRKLI